MRCDLCDRPMPARYLHGAAPHGAPIICERARCKPEQEYVRELGYHTTFSYGPIIERLENSAGERA